MESIASESASNIRGNREHARLSLTIWLASSLLWLRVHVFVTCVNNMVRGTNSSKLVSCQIPDLTEMFRYLISFKSYIIDRYNRR